TSHSPRRAASSPPVLPTARNFAEKPRSRSRPSRRSSPVQCDPITTKSAGRTPAPSSRTSTTSPASRYSRCRGTVTNPSARPNAVTEPEPLPIGNAASGGSEPGRSTRPTRTYSVRPRSLLTRIGRTATTVPGSSGGRPAIRRSTGATNSWNVNTADVGNPGRTATGTGRESSPLAPRAVLSEPARGASGLLL